MGSTLNTADLSAELVCLYTEQQIEQRTGGSRWAFPPQQTHAYAPLPPINDPHSQTPTATTHARASTSSLLLPKFEIQAPSLSSSSSSPAMASSLAPPAPPYAVLVVALPPTPAPPASASHAIVRSVLIILGVISLIAAASIAINCLLRRASRRRAATSALPLSARAPASGAAPLPLPRSGPAPARRAPALLAAADCTVCLSAIVPRAEAQLACRHRFHTTCIDEWVRSSPVSPTCPVCRAAVQPPRLTAAVDQRRTARRSSAEGDRRRVAASGEAPPGPSRVSGV